MSKLITLSRFSAALTSTFQKKVIIFRPATPQSSRILQWLSENGQINLGSQKIASLAVQGFCSQSLQIQPNIKALTERISFKSSWHFLSTI